MKTGHVLIVIGIVLGALAGFLLVSQRRAAPGSTRATRDTPRTWIRLE